MALFGIMCLLFAVAPRKIKENKVSCNCLDKIHLSCCVSLVLQVCFVKEI